ncbi:DUF378 domain-containing protein [Cohnella mopanensis]|uniref:DUF378 domain-containing protein n=1 Tax=Cohnella mopanensis TaxID=2911966 RepID=UPI001EF8D718|nr:DUF378 domain-containing protein [Cohnella mopanensis]
MKTLNVVALCLLIVGGLNWFLVGLFEYDLVARVFGTNSALSRIVYVVVGICAIYCIKFINDVRAEEPAR